MRSIWVLLEDKTLSTTARGIAEQIQWEFEDPAAFEGSHEDRLNQTRHARAAIRARINEWAGLTAG